ncbi:MAG TPA: 50S ribosomal protein L11 methyltransferase [Flavisolibacter sp.]|nr:50S ribosomal protein L11 methyltransferase [Flavisolibacter sp.]
MNSILITIKATNEQQEILISDLADLAEGFEQTDDALLAYFNELNFESYEVNKLLSVYKFETQVIKERNWNQEWERNFKPVKVGSFCYIRAEFHEKADDVLYDIVITPKMSFGTGHHATTYMMVEQMKNLSFKNKSVLDFGTGTGILAILGKKCGAQNVLAIDNDEWSIKNSKENSINNGCEITIQLASTIPDDRFDIILANINRNVIVATIHSLKNALVDNGYLLISGLLKQDKEFIDAVTEGLQMRNILEKDNWISILYKKGI